MTATIAATATSAGSGARVPLSAASLFLSGAGSLAAQVIIQRYMTTIFGGMDIVVMYLVALSFLGGLGAGSLVAGSAAAKVKGPHRFWALADATSGLFVLLFLPATAALNRLLEPAVAATVPEAGKWLFYLYCLSFQVSTTALLAFIMGMNYPFAAESLIRGGRRSPAFYSLVALAANTLGASTGSCLVALFGPHYSLPELARKSANHIAAMQHVFRYVYAIPQGDVFVASDTDLGQRLSPTRLRDHLALLPSVRRQMAAAGEFTLVRLPPLAEPRIVRDEDPVTDHIREIRLVDPFEGDVVYRDALPAE